METIHIVTNEFDLRDFYKECQIRQTKRDEENLLNKPTRYIKDIQYLQSLLPVDVTSILDSKLKNIEIKGIPNYLHGKPLYKSMKVVYDDFIFDIEFEETFMRTDCRLLISIESPLEIGFDRDSDYIIEKKAHIFYNEFAVRFNHMMIQLLNNIKEGCNKELENVIRFDLGTGIGRYSHVNIPYNILEKKISSNENVSQSQNHFNNGYYYVSFKKESIDSLPKFCLKQIEAEKEIIKSYFVGIYYSDNGYGGHISPENPYLEQSLKIFNKLSDISISNNVHIVLNTKISSADIIIEEDEEEDDIDVEENLKIVTLKDLLDTKKIDIEDFKLFHQIIFNTKDSYQKEIKNCILSKKTRKGVAYYPHIKYIYINQRLHDENSTEGNRTKDGETNYILFNNYKRKF